VRFSHRGTTSRNPGHLASDATPSAGQIRAGAQQPPDVAARHMISCYSRPASNQNALALAAARVHTCQKRPWDLSGIRFDDIGSTGQVCGSLLLLVFRPPKERHHGAGLTQTPCLPPWQQKRHRFPTNRQRRLCRLQDLIQIQKHLRRGLLPLCMSFTFGPRSIPCAIEEPSTLPCVAPRRCILSPPSKHRTRRSTTAAALIQA
jgi:hypothetical protein